MTPTHTHNLMPLRKIIPHFINERGNLAVKCKDGLVAVDIDDLTKHTPGPLDLIHYFDTFTVQKDKTGFIMFFKCPGFNKSIFGENGRILSKGEIVVICDSSTRKIVHQVSVDECTRAFLEEYAILWIQNPRIQSDPEAVDPSISRRARAIFEVIKQ